MTSYSVIHFDCSCGNPVEAFLPQSICTWLDPGLVEQLLDGSLFSVVCKSCKKVIKISTVVLMNTPRGMWYLRTDHDIDEIKTFLFRSDVSDEEGNVYSPQEMVEKLESHKKDKTYQKS
ncbi:MAG: CpXC domain-containing protein [Candidatus Heimdallarchaeota archaeon]